MNISRICLEYSFNIRLNKKIYIELNEEGAEIAVPNAIKEGRFARFGIEYFEFNWNIRLYKGDILNWKKIHLFSLEGFEEGADIAHKEGLYIKND